MRIDATGATHDGDATYNAWMADLRPQWPICTHDKKTDNSMTDPILLTPGPLTTSEATKAAMMYDWGSWDGAFNA